MSAAFPYEKKTVTVNGRRMAVVDHGEGDPIVFLHGNPTSSYLWRNVMPHLEGRGRLIAPDLIAGIHFVQEDSPDEIGRAVSDWLAAIG